jgi:hypothetical protein
MRLIGLTGKANAGKDRFGEYLNRSLGYEIYSFAGPLKDACCQLFGWSRFQIDHDREFKEAIDPRWGFSPRHAMQKMGTEYGREMLRDDLWLVMATNRLAELEKGMLVLDVRFENEAAWIRDNGGLLIHIERPGNTKVLSHVSENGVEFQDGDEVVVNSGSLDALLVKAQNLASNLMRGE